MPSFSASVFERKLLSGSLTPDELVEGFLVSENGGEVFDIHPFNGSIGFLLCHRHPDKVAAIVGHDPVLFALSVTGYERQSAIIDAFLTPKIAAYVFLERTWPNVVEFLYERGGHVDAATAYFNRGLDRGFVTRYITHGVQTDAKGICATLTHPRFAVDYWSSDRGWMSMLTPDELALVATFVVSKQPRRALERRLVIAPRIGDDVLQHLIGNSFGAVDMYEGLDAADLAWLPLQRQVGILSDLVKKHQAVDVRWLFSLHRLVGEEQQKMIFQVLDREPLERLYRALHQGYIGRPFVDEVRAYCLRRRLAEGYLFGEARIGYHYGRMQYQVICGGKTYIHQVAPKTTYALEDGMPVLFLPGKPLNKSGPPRVYGTTFIPLRPLTPR